VISSAMASPRAQEVFVTRHVSPREEMTPDCFGVREVDIPPLGPNSLLLKTKLITLEPYMRFGMSGDYQIGGVRSGKVVGEVLESTYSKVAPGDLVKCTAPWRTTTWVKVDKNLMVEKLDPSVPPQLYLGLAGSGGRTAGLLLKHRGSPKPGQTAFVSGATSSVGLVAVQLMALNGVRVVGSCGSDEKVEVLAKLKCTAFNYHKESAEAAIRRLCPEGIDFFFDNVGGSLRLAVIEAMNPHGAIIQAGSISGYDGSSDGGGGDRMKEEAIKKQKKINDLGGGWVGTWEHEWESFSAELIELYKQGKLVNHDTVVEGFANLPTAFCGIFKGQNIGRMVLKVE